MRQALKIMLNSQKGPWAILTAWGVIPALLYTLKKFDYKKRAGALVIGLNKLAVKTHGSADKTQFLSSLDLLSRLIENDFVETLKKENYHKVEDKSE